MSKTSEFNINYLFNVLGNPNRWFVLKDTNPERFKYERIFNRRLRSDILWHAYAL